MSVKRETVHFKDLTVPIILLVAFWAIGVIFWQIKDRAFFLYNFGIIGTSLFIGFGLYAILPRKKKPIGRKVAQALVGLYMVGFLGLFMKQNMQIEGFFFYLSAGIFGGSVIHYLVAKIVGPVLFGRGYCAWACWTSAVLDLLPYTRNKQGRVSHRWEWLRYAHFFVSLGLVMLLLVVFAYEPAHHSWEAVYWLAGGNLLYYAVAIVLAFVLKDNRAFCKYACPIVVPLKLTSRFSALKIAGNREACNDCGACSKICPMDIDVSAYVKQGRRVLSTECIFCNTCITTCPEKALTASFAFDMGGIEKIQRREFAPERPERV